MEEENIDNEKQKLSPEQRKDLGDYRLKIIDKLNKQEGTLDKFLLAITSVNFNIILLFINNIIKLETAKNINLFYSALICSILSVIMILLGTLRSNHILSTQIDIINEGLLNDQTTYQKEQDYLDKRKFPCSKFHMDEFITFNNMSTLLVCLSIILISCFLYFNIEHLRESANNDSQEINQLNTPINREDSKMSQQNNLIPGQKSFSGKASNATPQKSNPSPQPSPKSTPPSQPSATPSTPKK